MTNHFQIQGIISVILSAFSYAIQAAYIKYIGTSLPLPIIIFTQSLIALILILSLMTKEIKRQGISSLQSKHLGKHIIRTLASLGISYTLFIALQHVILVDAILMLNTSPFFVPFLWLIFAKTPIQHRLWPPLIIGFIGVILILKPSSDFFNVYMLLALASGICMASSVSLARTLTVHDNSIKSAFYYFWISSIISGFISIPYWSQIHTAPSLYNNYIEIIAPLIFIGILFFFVQYLLVIALQYIPSQTASILYYSNVIFAAVLGDIFFSENMGWRSISGMILIILSGIIVILIQTKKHTPLQT